MDNPHAQPPSSQTLQQRSTQSNPHLPALSGPLAALPAATQASLLALFSSNCFNADPATLASLLPLLLPGISSARSGQATETGLHSLQTLSQVAGASLHNRQNGASQGISGGRWVLAAALGVNKHHGCFEPCVTLKLSVKGCRSHTSTCHTIQTVTVY